MTYSQMLACIFVFSPGREDSIGMEKTAIALVSKKLENVPGSRDL